MITPATVSTNISSKWHFRSSYKRHIYPTKGQRDFCVWVFMMSFLCEKLHNDYCHIDWETVIKSMCQIKNNDVFVFDCVSCETRSHYMKQCGHIVNWNLRNKFHWNINQYTFLQKICIWYPIFKITASLFVSRCDNIISLMESIPFIISHCLTYCAVSNTFLYLIH